MFTWLCWGRPHREDGFEQDIEKYQLTSYMISFSIHQGWRGIIFRQLVFPIAIIESLLVILFCVILQQRVVLPASEQQ